MAHPISSLFKFLSNQGGRQELEDSRIRQAPTTQGGVCHGKSRDGSFACFDRKGVRVATMRPLGTSGFKSGKKEGKGGNSREDE